MVVARERLLVLNPKAGGLSEEDATKLRQLLSVIAVAGGDGTVAAAAPALAGTDRRLAIIPLRTFNNFVRALGIPREGAAAARGLRTGRTEVLTRLAARTLPFLRQAAPGLRVRHFRIETEPSINVNTGATQVGATPVEIRVDLDALKVVLPA